MTKRKKRQIERIVDRHLEAIELLFRAAFNQHRSEFSTDEVLHGKTSEDYGEEVTYLTDYMIEQVNERFLKWNPTKSNSCG